MGRGISRVSCVARADLASSPKAIAIDTAYFHVIERKQANTMRKQSSRINFRWKNRKEWKVEARSGRR